MTRFDEVLDGGADAGQSRRTLLGGVAAGFVLAASGLFLAADDDEAAAREGANGGDLGGRRGKDRRGLDRRKRRDRGDKKDNHGNNGNNPPQAGGPWENELVVRVSNVRGQPVEVQGWIGGSQGWTTANDWWWSTLPPKPSTGPAAARDFERIFAHQGLAVQIGHEGWVHCFMLSAPSGRRFGRTGPPRPSFILTTDAGRAPWHSATTYP